MKLDDFVRNLRGIDDGHDVDLDMLTGIYERVRTQEFKPGGDHVTQVRIHTCKTGDTIIDLVLNVAGDEGAADDRVQVSATGLAPQTTSLLLQTIRSARSLQERAAR